MNTPQHIQGLREQKKRLTRQQLSNTRHRTVYSAWFDNVTIADIAAAAGVSKMTVFNYFPRKEELYFDRIDEVHQLLRQAFDRHSGLVPVAVLEALAEELMSQQHPLVRMDRRVAAFWQGVEASPSLQAYALEQFALLTQALSAMLASRLQRPAYDPLAQLIASIVLNGWRIAYGDALRLQQEQPADVVRERFLAHLERGFHAARAAAQDTPYA
ncbi:transcriptional regulator BetI [Raoultella terrigena]|uniref:Transcriptional regulator BetI n=1 Tax=Raoultella terrigena TaxID=577 RepID=A0A3P8IRJ8_RAOTE|nr:transcriptional regulator BetI [Raoultella terrigena]